MTGNSLRRSPVIKHKNGRKDQPRTRTIGLNDLRDWRVKSSTSCYQANQRSRKPDCARSPENTLRHPLSTLIVEAQILKLKLMPWFLLNVSIYRCSSAEAKYYKSPAFYYWSQNSVVLLWPLTSDLQQQIWSQREMSRETSVRVITRALNWIQSKTINKISKISSELLTPTRCKHTDAVSCWNWFETRLKSHWIWPLTLPCHVSDLPVRRFRPVCESGQRSGFVQCPPGWLKCQMGRCPPCRADPRPGLQAAKINLLALLSASSLSHRCCSPPSKPHFFLLNHWWWHLPSHILSFIRLNFSCVIRVHIILAICFKGLPLGVAPHKKQRCLCMWLTSSPHSNGN